LLKYSYGICLRFYVFFEIDTLSIGFGMLNHWCINYRHFEARTATIRMCTWSRCLSFGVGFVNCKPLQFLTSWREAIEVLFSAATGWSARNPRRRTGRCIFWCLSLSSVALFEYRSSKQKCCITLIGVPAVIQTNEN